MTQLILFPHNDMHLALQKPAAKVLPFRVFRQEPVAATGAFSLQDVTGDCNYHLLAPYKPVGQRLAATVTIDKTARTITANSTGINLVVVEFGGAYTIARIQVHQDILGWWFGNAAIITGVDAAIAYSQPTLHALFSDDATGTDQVGDITGHGWVTLTSGAPGTFVVANANNEGRLRGVAEGTATLNGTFLGITQSLPVTVVDYGKNRNILAVVRAADLANPAEMHNILFLSEGFRASEQGKFDRIVQEVTDALFTAERHAPFNTLASSFNVFKAFQASNEHALTCGFRVNDESTSELSTGCPIPYDGHIPESDKNSYTVSELVERVGLPLRNETATPAQLKARWATQSLHNYDPAKVSDELIEAWRKQKSLGILETRDTFFGLMLGTRFAQRMLSGGTQLTMPASDTAVDPNLAPLIARAYEFFRPEGASRSIGPDPRRHPPELQGFNQESVGGPLMRFIAGLRLAAVPHTAIGPEWVPGATFKPSRGLIAMITNDGMHGGTNFNSLTITANSLNKNTHLDFEYPATNTATKKVMRRTPPGDVSEDLDGVIDTVAHEFGHSFNLDDEYETRPGDRGDGNSSYDNVTALKDIFADANWATNHSRLVDADKIKWFDLLRMRLSARLVADSTEVSGSIEVRIDPRQIPRWEAEKAAHHTAYLRRNRVSPQGAQLPLAVGDADYLVRLDIGDIDAARGSIRLGGLELPPTPFPVFPRGSLLFVPKRDAADNLVFVVEKKVRDFIAGNHLPLNKETDTTRVNSDGDDPVSVPDFKPPCSSQRLIGLFEGASNFTGLIYRPAGNCKMRNRGDSYCHVCKWLITNRVDPSRHDVVDRLHYPTAKKNG